MVNDSNRVNIFLVLGFIINNHPLRFVSIVSYVKHSAILSTTTTVIRQIVPFPRIHMESEIHLECQISVCQHTQNKNYAIFGYIPATRIVDQ